MKRLAASAILALLGIALFVVPAMAQDQPKVVTAKPVHDLGVVPKGDTVTIEFELRNEGTAPLLISEVRPSCGCTVVDFDKEIAPGAVGKIQAEVDTTNLHGPNSKSVTVYTNDPNNPTVLLTLKSDVRPYISVLPGYARFNMVQGEKEGNVAQTLWTEDATPFKVVNVTSPLPHVKTSFREANESERRPNVSGSQWLVEVVLTNDAPVGPLTGYLDITTDHPKQKNVRLPVSGFVRPILAVTPPVADFRTIEIKEEPLRTNLLVKNFASEEIVVTATESTLEQVTAEIVPLEAGRSYQLKVEIDPSMPKGAFQGVLKIKTNSSKQPEVKVTLKGNVT